MGLFVLVFLVSYVYHGTGITLGYHRLLSHRSYRVPKLLEYFIVLGGYLCLEGAPIFWVTTHRLHHRYSDQPGDPHSPTEGKWHAFLGWMYHPTVKISKEESERLAPDLYRDPFFKALHLGHSQLDGPLCLLINVLFRVGIFAIWGPVVFAAELLGAVCAFAAPLLVNLFCHLPSLGYAPYQSHDQSRNNPVVAMLSFGEGWHNSHHAFPQSARFGLLPKEFDFSWEVIKIMKAVGLATEIRLGTADKSKQLAKAKSVVSTSKK